MQQVTIHKVRDRRAILIRVPKAQARLLRMLAAQRDESMSKYIAAVLADHLLVHDSASATGNVGDDVQEAADGKS